MPSRSRCRRGPSASQHHLVVRERARSPLLRPRSLFPRPDYPQATFRGKLFQPSRVCCPFARPLIKPPSDEFLRHDQLQFYVTSFISQVHAGAEVRWRGAGSKRRTARWLSWPAAPSTAITSRSMTSRAAEFLITGLGDLYNIRGREVWHFLCDALAYTKHLLSWKSTRLRIWGSEVRILSGAPMKSVTCAAPICPERALGQTMGRLLTERPRDQRRQRAWLMRLSNPLRMQTGSGPGGYVSRSAPSTAGHRFSKSGRVAIRAPTELGFAAALRATSARSQRR